MGSVLRKSVAKSFVLLLVVCIIFSAWGGAPRIASSAVDDQPPSVVENPQVLISQFMYDLPGSDDGKEYIVIKNYEDVAVDISGFMIGDGINQGKGEGMAAFPEGTIIEPGQEIFLAQSGLIFKDTYGAIPDFEFPWFGTYRLEEDPDVPNMLPTDWSTGVIQLANGGDEILLMDRDYNIVDFVPYIKDITYRGVDYKAVTALAPGDGNTIHRVSRTGDLTVDFEAGPINSPSQKTPPIPASSDLLITEVMYTPYFDESENEYIEITNISDEPIDISGYYLGDKVVEGGASAEAMYNFPEGTVIDPYEVMVIARNSRGIERLYGIEATFEFEETNPNVPKMIPNCDWGCATTQLANYGDEVLLLDKNKKVIDAVVYAAGLYRGIKAHPGVGGKGRSLERTSDVDTKNVAVDFVEQPQPTPGVLLFGPNGRPDLVPESDLKDKVLRVNEPDTALVAGPTIIDASEGMPETIPSNVPSFLLNVGLSDDGKIVAMNRDIELTTALDLLEDKMIPALELNETHLIEPVHEILDDRELTDVLIISKDPDIVKEIRTLNDEYRGVVRFEGTVLNETDLKSILTSVRDSTGLVAMIDHRALSLENVHYFRSRALTVWGYGVATEAEAHRLITLGVSGIEAAEHSSVTAALKEYDTENSINQPPIIVAHRGMSALAPENTIPAFELAVEMGMEVIELDIHASKDGEPVIIHDYTVDRTTDGTGKVNELTLAQLKELTANKTDNADWRDNYNQYPDAEIPTLEEVLQNLKGTGVVLALEFKATGIEEKVVSLLEQYGMVTDVYVTSFNPDVLKRIQTLNPEIGSCYILSDSSPDGAGALQYAEKIVTDNVQLGMFPMSGGNMLTPEMTNYAKHRGLPLIAATFNTKQGIQNMKKRGITTILSDYAHWMEEVPVSINPVPEDYTISVGEKFSPTTINASVSFRTSDSQPVFGGIRVLGTNDGVVRIEEGEQEITALKPGQVTLQVYHDYQPFNKPVEGDPALLPDKWRMYSTPITLTVSEEVELSIPVMLNKLENYREEVYSDDVYHSIQTHLIAVGRFEEQEKSDKIVKHMQSFKLLLDQHFEENIISERLYTILKDDADHLIAKWE